MELSYHLITDVSALCEGLISALVEGLKVNTTLTSLGLIGNEIIDEGTRALAEALKINTTLTELKLDDNQITAVGASALSEALKVNTALTNLDLR